MRNFLELFVEIVALLLVTWPYFISWKFGLLSFPESLHIFVFQLVSCYLLRLTACSPISIVSFPAAHNPSVAHWKKVHLSLNGIQGPLWPDLPLQTFSLFFLRNQNICIQPILQFLLTFSVCWNNSNFSAFICKSTSFTRLFPTEQMTT